MWERLGGEFSSCLPSFLSRFLSNSALTYPSLFASINRAARRRRRSTTSSRSTSRRTMDEITVRRIRLLSSFLFAELRSLLSSPAYNSVVRGKEQRKQLHGRDCECCRGVSLVLSFPSSPLSLANSHFPSPLFSQYYEAVGPLPPLPQGPRWKSAPPESSEDEAADDEMDENGAGPSKRRRRAETKEERGKRKRDEEIEKHRQEASRHRDAWAGPPTP